jgi:predicted RND superfamily exporter protein
LVDTSGRARLSVLPRGDMSEVDDLRDFVAAVKTVAPHATGRPPIEVGVGDLVVESFRIAIFISLVLIAVVMLLYLRDPVDVFVLLVPILLGALFTIAIAVLIDMPFNMSNVVVIPLVMGLGVDTAIHMVLRFRESGSLAAMMASSTPRAAILSALTTLAAFGSLSVSGHLGIRSLGLLLAISVFCLIFTSLVILPAMILLRRPVRRWIYRHEAAAVRGGR